MGETVPVDLDSDRDVDGAGFEPVERDTGIGVFGHLVEFVGFPAAGRDDLYDDLEVECGQWPQVIGGAAAWTLRVRHVPRL
jgi:hypothetical protein